MSGGDRKARRAGAPALQQGPAHPQDGLLRPRSLPQRQVHIHDQRRTRHRALHHIAKGNVLYTCLLFLYFFGNDDVICEVWGSFGEQARSFAFEFQIAL